MSLKSGITRNTNGGKAVTKSPLEAEPLVITIKPFAGITKSEPEPEQHIIVEGLGNGYVLTTDQQIKECEGVPEGKLAIISTKQLDDYVRVEDTSMSEFVKAFNRGDFKYEKIRIDPGGTSEPGDN